MRIGTSLICLSALSLLTACGNPNDGYYDANGTYIPPANTTTEAQRIHAPSPTEHMGEYYADHRYGHYVEPSSYYYDRRGYYDYYGNYYSSLASGAGVPEGMLPPRGMCRVWFPDRVPSEQPKIESCNDIHARAPMGTYVIYGG
jgi:hypothetical protein